MSIFIVKPTVGRIRKWESKIKYKPLLKALNYPDKKIKVEAASSLSALINNSFLPEQANIEVRNRILEFAKTLDMSNEILITYCACALRHFDGKDIRDYYHSILKNDELIELYGKHSMILQWTIRGLCKNSGDGTSLELLMHLIEGDKLGITTSGDFRDYGEFLLRRAVRSEGYDSDFLNMIITKASKNVKGNKELGCYEADVVLSKAFNKDENHSAKQEVKTWLYSKHEAVRKYADRF